MRKNDKTHFVQDYCNSTGCGECKLRKVWVHEGSDEECMIIPEASVKELDWAMELILGTSQDAVNHPSHYNQGKYECFDVMVETFGKEETKNFCLLNAFKYIWRANEKNGSEDVKKAIWYLEKMMEMEDAE